ncbi:neural-cadherin-like isoform X4 [Ostrea edulis]|uniref:neural-cadherin-like isoform X4 n=1 Tax=Ostrea edulis TaxID=37623 RepID=UPI0024AE990A|nr:neural-cadherin-like isoform X4 [Ostrea edulis]
MADSVQFTNTTCMCSILIVTIVFTLLRSVTSDSVTPVIVPSTAEVGYKVLKLGCSKSDLQLRTKDPFGDFYDNFALTDTGELVLRRTVPHLGRQGYKLTVITHSGCYDNVPTKRTFTLDISPRETDVFPDRVYTGYILTTEKSDSMVTNLSRIHVHKVPQQEFVLQGFYSDYFKILSSDVTNEIRVVLQKEFPSAISKRAWYFSLLSKVGSEITGHANVEILLVDNPYPKHVQLQSMSENNLRSLHLTAKFNQDPPNIVRSRVLRRRRQTSGTKKQTVQLQENATGVIFTVDSGQPQGTNIQFEIRASTPEDIFLIDRSTGEVTLKSNAKLDFDYNGVRKYVINIDVKRQEDSTVLQQVEVTVDVLNVNDEPPRFITKPTPYLAVVATDAQAGVSVFRIEAEDVDGGTDAVKYFKESVGSSPYFEVGQDTGIIRTTEAITSGLDYVIKVYAIDSKAEIQQKTGPVNINIRRGQRAPQFYSSSYEASVEESNQADQTFQAIDADGNNASITAKNFQVGGTTKYSVYESPTAISTRFAIEDGMVKTLRTLDYESDQHKFVLTVRAEDTISGLSSDVKLTVNLLDRNEFTPLFSKSTFTTTVKEDIPRGTSVIEVSASDKDGSTILSYTVTDPIFSITTTGNGQVGVIHTNGTLDYDRKFPHYYEFKVIASDNGVEPRTAEARVIVTTNNTNDQAPEFDDNKVATLMGNAQPGSTVIIVRAVDEDGDKVTYSFDGGRTVSDVFEIDPASGRISLRAGQSPPSDRDQIFLNVTAKDDGSCCDGPGKILSSTATITINIEDEENVKPRFVNCAYTPTVTEEQDPGVLVQKVSATDPNRGQNGKLEYSITSIKELDDSQEKNYFSINSSTGEIYTREKLDRETQSSKNLFITVKVQDKGSNPLDDYCTFAVTIQDINDNDPEFGTSRYEGRVLKSAAVGQKFLTIKATDKDLGDNANIKYSLKTNPNGLFQVNVDTGDIEVAKSLQSAGSQITLVATATDQGTTPRSTDVNIDISVTTDSDVLPPLWTPLNPTYTVKESEGVNFVIATLTAQNRITNIPDSSLIFNMVINNNGQTELSDRTEKFIILSGADRVNLTILEILDYETQKEYTLNLRASNIFNTPINSDNYPKIVVQDANDEIPKFLNIDPQNGNIGLSVLENEAAGTPVQSVSAIDADETEAFKKVTYALHPDGSTTTDQFAINPTTGMITTRVQFDRESTDFYIMKVFAIDGAPSSRDSSGAHNTGSAVVRVSIKDVNDNNPYFEESLYFASVREDSFTGQSITTIAAKDPDEATFTYSLSGSSLFAVKSGTGEIYVAGNLDYETEPNVYNVTLVVNDGKFSNQTTVQITIIDTNDNSPKFEQNTYAIRTLEEGKVYNQVLITVRATDPDIHRNPRNEIEYSLSQDDAVINSLFTINKNTGAISINGELDRDKPNGREVYQFTVLAIDEPTADSHLTGYATVQVFPLDINDNSPQFDPNSLIGVVNEMSAPDVLVMTISATDNDDGDNAKVSYAITAGTQLPREAFRINENTGEVYTTVSDLDREKHPVYTFTVVAKDAGAPTSLSTTATATVNIKDINDNEPVFEENIYRITIPETQEGLIITIRANDLDIDDTLTYSLIGPNDRTHFQITVDGRDGRLEVYTRPDYETPAQRFFNLTVQVSDGKFTDITYIEITVEDVNDEIPIITPQNVEINRMENVAIGDILANFVASDRDEGINGLFDFYVSRKPISEKPDYYFRIMQTNENGTVILKNSLDHETITRHIVRILVIDRGIPPNTGTATLTINVGDINDEDPTFMARPEPKVMEGSPPKQVTVLYGVDPDGSPYGGPFTFNLDCANSICNKFSLQENPSGDNGNGIATIRSLVKFDREEQKFYYLPIVMTDMRGHPDQPTLGRTATSTLTIEIGDENDNPHSPAHQNIHVYNYKGLFGNIDIGQVSDTDLDDDDLDDKTFTLLGPVQGLMYFTVNKDSGMIRMLEHVPPTRTGYPLQVKIFDRVFSNLNVVSTVTVYITELPEEAPYMSGSVRLTGTTPEEFIKKPSNGESPYTKFRLRMKDKLGVPSIDNVQIISVLKSTVDDVDYTDARFAAYGSPYFQGSQLDGIVNQYRNEFQQDTGATIAMVGIDMCYREICEGGGCNNKLIVYDEPNMVTTNGQSVVGVKTSVVAECACTVSTNVKSCTPNYCLNGGTCKMNAWDVISCECLAGFDGPRCQVTKQGFDGTGYAIYEPLQQCENSLTSIEIITTKADGLILYSGPVTTLDPNAPQDFMYLQLAGGYPELVMDHGSGSVTLTLNGRDSKGVLKMSSLNDGKWHKIDIRRQGKFVTLTVDHCLSADSQDGENQDRTACENSGSTRGEHIFLNVNAPLQMGGRYISPAYPAGVSNQKFKGCVRNMRHNGELYNLYTKNFYPGSRDGCPEEDNACESPANQPKKCGEEGKCELVALPQSIRCICNPGYRGTTCELKTTEKFFQTQSYMDWMLQKQFIDSLVSRTMDIQLMYRTRDKSGMIFHVTGEGIGEFIKLEIVENVIQVLYNLGDGNKVLQMVNVTAADGYWHTLYFRRQGRSIILSQDGGEGPLYVETTADSKYQSLVVKNTQVYAGAEVSYEHSKTIDQTNPKDLENSCLTDIRMDMKWFPVTSAENNQNSNVKMVTETRTTNDCSRDDCNGNTCATYGKICFPLWGLHKCVCPEHHQEIGATCVFIDYCQNSPCHHQATCVSDKSNAEHGYYCRCSPNMEGRLCNVYKEPVVSDAGNSDWVIGLVIGLIILAIIVVVIVAFLLVKKQRRAADQKNIMNYEKEDYDIRENIVDYDEDGAGEDDHEGYDINRLRKPADMTRMDKPIMASHSRPLKSGQPAGTIGNFITDRLDDANDDPDAPPHDTLRDFQYEGEGSDAGSLSSLNTTSSGGDQDYDFLNEWGPKFSKLADMYNNYDDDSD